MKQYEMEEKLKCKISQEQVLKRSLIKIDVFLLAELYILPTQVI